MMQIMSVIRFKFAAQKALSAVHWMVCKKPGVDLHTVLKACYFADKDHLNRHHRPVFGATYRAMRFGPVPLEIYEMAKGEAIWLPEVTVDAYPWRLDGYRLAPHSNTPPDLDHLAPFEMGALEQAFDKSCSMNFDARTAATHGPDWQAAELGTMRYEDMIDEGPDKAALIAHLRAYSKLMKL